MRLQLNRCVVQQMLTQRRLLTIIRYDSDRGYPNFFLILMAFMTAVSIYHFVMKMGGAKSVDLQLRNKNEQ